MPRSKKGIYQATTADIQAVEESVDLGTPGPTLIGMTADGAYTSTATETILEGTFHMNGADLAIVKWQLDWFHTADAIPGSGTFDVDINGVTFYSETYNEDTSASTGVWTEGYLMFMTPAINEDFIAPLVFGSSMRVMLDSDAASMSNPLRAVTANGNVNFNPDEDQTVAITYTATDAGTDLTAIMGRMYVEYPPVPPSIYLFGS